MIRYIMVMLVGTTPKHVANSTHSFCSLSQCWFVFLTAMNVRLHRY